MKKPTIDLWKLDGLALIVKTATGILYTNQVGGNFCLQEKVEGALVPLPNEPGRPAEYALAGFFRNHPGFVTDENAEQIDRLFRRNGLEFLKIDRERLRESWEAWIHVHIDPDQATDIFTDAPDWKTGVVTWPNSD